MCAFFLACSQFCIAVLGELLVAVPGVSHSLQGGLVSTHPRNGVTHRALRAVHPSTRACQPGRPCSPDLVRRGDMGSEEYHARRSNVCSGGYCPWYAQWVCLFVPHMYRAVGLVPAIRVRFRLRAPCLLACRVLTLQRCRVMMLRYATCQVCDHVPWKALMRTP